MNDTFIVIDVNSGAVHVVDEMLYDLIERLNQGQKKDEILMSLVGQYEIKDLEEAFEEINQLITDKLLFSSNPYLGVVESFKERETVVKAMCLHIAHDCNLACKYCFASEGEYHGTRSMMSLEVGKKAVDYLIENSGSRKNLEIDFFGGEPLMNFNVVKDIVEYAKSKEQHYNKRFRFTITTNGMLLSDEMITYINENMYNVVLSIDGRKSVHDAIRPTPNGKGSYDIILPKFLQVAESRNQTNYYVRGTFTHHNLDFTNDVLHLADLGFKQISVEPVVAPDNMPYAIKPEDLPFIYEQYEQLAEKMLQYDSDSKGFNFFHFMIDLNQGPCVVKRMTGCGAGSEYLAVTPEGDLYPCHQFVGIDGYKMGSVFNGIDRKDIVEDFKNCHLFTKEECNECWAKFYCGGGCNANAYNFHGNIHKVYEMACELEKKRVECAIYLKAKNI
jgi:uncharacterized protein